MNPLTIRDIQILNLLKDGYSHKEIARKLGFSYNTINGYVQQVEAKLEARNAVHAVIIAIRNDLIKLGI